MQAMHISPQIWAFLGLALTFLTWFAIRKGKLAMQFRKDSRNPYRRYCRQCGQCQTAQCYPWDHVRAWWVTQGDVLDSSCSCHAHVKS